jgi:hypothetical protein
VLSRKATRSAQQPDAHGIAVGSGFSARSSIGIQYRRMTAPIAVPGPTCVKSSFPPA